MKGSQTCVALNSRLESHKEERKKLTFRYPWVQRLLNNPAELQKFAEDPKVASPFLSFFSSLLLSSLELSDANVYAP